MDLANKAEAGKGKLEMQAYMVVYIFYVAFTT
jgi:hypothetical protein